MLPLSNEDLRDVIERPASLSDVRLTFDEDLVGDLLFDLQGQVGALPLLEFALDQLFHHRRDHRLTRHAYQEIGGVRGALSRHAESTYQALASQEHQQLARTLFTRLLQFGTQVQEPTRRRADRSEFTLEDARQSQKLSEVIDAFVSARLLTMNQFLATPTLEISHEALIREWPRLGNWQQEAREDIRLQQDISNDAREWELRKKPKDRLYRGSQLKEALAWQMRNMASGNEAAFLRTSAAGQRRIAVTGLIFGVIGLGIWLLPIITVFVIPSFDRSDGTATLVGGFVALFTWVSPVISIPSSIIGFILSLRGLRLRLHAVRASRRWVAILGLILSIIGLVINVALIILFFILVIFVLSKLPSIQ